MNWTALSSIAEVAAALGLVVSIIYLARQVHQNTIQVREQVRSHHLASLATVSEKFSAWRHAISGNSDLASAWTRGNTRLESLNNVERVRFDYHAIEFHRCLSLMWMFAEQGVFAANLVDQSMKNAALYAQPGLRTWWQVTRHRAEFPEGFVKRLDAIYSQTVPAPSDGSVSP